MDSYLASLYKKYLQGAISLDEFRELRYHLNKMDDEALATILEEEWDNGPSGAEISPKAKSRISNTLDFYIRKTQKRSYRALLLKVAAVVVPVIVLGMGALMMLRQPAGGNRLAVSVDRGDKAYITLPDSSRVRINSNSTLEYASDGDNERMVKLEGEAFFKVAKNRKRPFRVTIGELIIEVLGTTFNVKAREGSDIIEASLVEGSIKLSGEELPKDYYLKPNEKAVYNRSDNSLRIVETDNEQETAWIHNKLQFSSEKFSDALRDIGDWYGVTIISKYDQINDDMISGSFNEENLETALSALQLQYNIKYKRKNDTIFIYKR